MRYAAYLAFASLLLMGACGDDDGATNDNQNTTLCGNGEIDAAEECDDAGESATCNADCTTSVCGDGIVNTTAGEACDDAGASANCNADCTATDCGDGVVNTDAGEECDDAGESASCNADCTTSACGDGVQNATAGETCDDGAESAACNDDCTAADCGDMVVNTTAGETCDASGETANCDDDCTAVECGDGLLNLTAGEQCDDAGMAAGDGCDASCIVEPGYDCTQASPSVCQGICGDFILAAGEQCDDGNIANGDGCSASCAFEATCANGIIEPGEACDDGNITAGDGCDASCVLEAGSACSDAVDLNDATNVTINGDHIFYSSTTVGSSIVDFSDPTCTTGTGGAPTVIHRYTATEPISLLLKTNDIGGMSDTVLWGHLDCLGTTDEVICDDDGGPNNLSEDTVFLAAGQTVYILVASYGSGGADTYELELVANPVQVTPPASDCSSPIPVSAGTYYGVVQPTDPSNFEPSCRVGAAGASEAVFELTLATATNVVVRAGGEPLGAFDIALHIHDGVCDPSAPVELDCADDTASTRAEEVALSALPAGTYYIVVDGSDTTDAGAYFLDIQTSTCGDGMTLAPMEQCDDGNAAAGDGCSATCQCEPVAEIEPNNDHASATDTNGFCLAVGAVGTAGDADYFAIALAAGQTLTVETVAGGADTCAPGGNIDSQLEIFDTDGVTLLDFNEDKTNTGANDHWCSLASYTATVAGTYFVNVMSSQQYAASDTFDYAMLITVQ